MIYPEIIAKQIQELRAKGLSQDQALQLIIADKQADAVARLAEAVTSVVRIIDRKQF